MYLPNSLYERAPHYWLFIGMLLVVLGIYLGIEMSSTFLYAGVSLGIASCAWAVSYTHLTLPTNVSMC